MDFQIMLLPTERFWKWARACSKYVRAYGLNLTSDPVTAANYMAPGQVVSFPSLPNAFPEQGDLVEWFDANHPGIRVDPVKADGPDDFSTKLQIRLDEQDRYGQHQSVTSDCNRADFEYFRIHSLFSPMLFSLLYSPAGRFGHDISSPARS